MVSFVQPGVSISGSGSLEPESLSTAADQESNGEGFEVFAELAGVGSGTGGGSKDRGRVLGGRSTVRRRVGRSRAVTVKKGFEGSRLRFART